MQRKICPGGFFAVHSNGITGNPPCYPIFLHFTRKGGIKMSLKISKNGLGLIKRHRAKTAEPKTDAQLKRELKPYEAKVNRYHARYRFNQNQFDALVSFAYNMGSIDQLTATGTRNTAEIAKKMMAYNKSGGKILYSLTKRRKAEKQLFLTPDSSPASASSKKTKITYITHRIPDNLWGKEITGYHLPNSGGYSGTFGSQIDQLAVKVNQGSVFYRTHRKDGAWSREITGFSKTESGKHAGVRGKPIDAVAIKAKGITGTLRYRVHSKSDQKWGKWITGYSKTNSSQYAGSFGSEIDAIQIGIR